MVTALKNSRKKGQKEDTKRDKNKSSCVPIVFFSLFQRGNFCLRKLRNPSDFFNGITFGKHGLRHFASLGVHSIQKRAFLFVLDVGHFVYLPKKQFVFDLL